MEEWDNMSRATPFPIKKSYSNLLSSPHGVSPWFESSLSLKTIYYKIPFLVGLDSQVLDLSFEQTQNKATLFTMWSVLYVPAFRTEEDGHFSLP